tara:strand:- start:767 stop:2434 length:1668 start_codon:yes stop_codon:yes gene_type:complete
MSVDFILFFLSYFIILTSILGYGLLFYGSLKKINSFNFGYIGLIGIFFLILYSYISNIFFSHSQIHNLLFLTIGFIYFIIYTKKFFNEIKKEFLFTIIIFTILFSSSLIIKNHDDFPYYHFPYTFYLTQQSAVFGVGQFNHGFRTPSSIFYINSLFYLPMVKYYLFNFSALYILGFGNIVLLKKIHNFFCNFKYNKNLNKNINYINYLSLLVFAFINVFFYRIGEHGTDRSAQILIFILVIFILECFYIKKINKIDLIFIYTLLGLIISLKAFYILYLLLIFPLFLFILKKKNNFLLTVIYFIQNKFFIFFVLLLIFVLLSYFFNTGCFIYPLSITCFENLSWGLPLDVVEKMNNWYELWSKAGANPNYRVTNPDQYILKFNWVDNWLSDYFFNKVSDFILGLFLMILVFFVIFVKPKNFKNKIKLDKYSILTFLILLILFMEWFYNHPALRYGGYCLLALIFFLPTSLYLSLFKINSKKFTNSIFILVLLTSVIFLGRNIHRINKEINVYNYMPLKQTFYKIDHHYFRIQKKMENIDKSKIKKIFGKKVFIVNK